MSASKPDTMTTTPVNNTNKDDSSVKKKKIICEAALPQKTESTTTAFSCRRQKREGRGYSKFEFLSPRSGADVRGARARDFRPRAEALHRREDGPGDGRATEKGQKGESKKSGLACLEVLKS